MKISKLHTVSFKLFSFLISLFFITSAAFALEPVNPQVLNDSQIETSLDRSIRLNAPLNGGVDRASTISSPVVDPSFNTMRNNDLETGKAKFYVIGLLVLATIVPLVVWLVLS